MRTLRAFHLFILPRHVLAGMVEWQTQMIEPTLAQQAEAASLKLVKSEFESLKWDHPKYKGWKIYGPYESKKDKRFRVVAYDGYSRITISYPKFIMECKNKSLLKINEDIHHKDDNVSNNLISNFEIINESEHKRNHQEGKSSAGHGTHAMCIKSKCRCPLCYSFLIQRRKQRRQKGQ